MIKNLIHSGAFLDYNDRKVQINFYKRGYFLTMKEGVSATINVDYIGGVFSFNDLFNTNGTITANETYAVEIGKTYVRIKENTFHYEREWKVTFRLLEDEDSKVTIIFKQAEAPNDLTANPAELHFSGKQEYLKLDLSSSEAEPLIWSVGGEIENYLMSESDQPTATYRERYGNGWKDTWYIGLELNDSGVVRTGQVNADIDGASMGGLLIPITQECGDEDSDLVAVMDIHDEDHGKEVTVGKYGNEGYIEFYYGNGDEVENHFIELVDVGYGTDWVTVRDTRTPFATSVFFDVDSVPDSDITQRWVIFRVHNADYPDKYAECMLIQRNY